MSHIPVHLSTSSVYPENAAYAFDLAQRLGYDGVEIMVWTDPVTQEAGALNALAAVRSVVGDLSAVTRVVKVVGFVASAPGFSGQPQVVNGASHLLGDVFGDVGQHARSAVGVAVLPLDAPVEVELVVEVSG